MSNKIVLIQSHCNDDYSRELLLKNIAILKDYEVDILLFSHITLPEHIISEVDYFIYDKSNPILFEERAWNYWHSNNEVRLETTVPDYGWTVFNQFIKSKNLISDSYYEHVILLCYDTLIDENVRSFLLNPEDAVFKHKKDDGVVFNTSLIFSTFTKDSFFKLVESFSKEEFIKKYSLTAEEYFEEKIKGIGVYNNKDVFTYDVISQSKNVFNQSKNTHYDLFIDTKSLLKFVVTNHSNKSIDIVVNDTFVSPKEETFIYNKKLDNIERLGCFIEGKYEDWLDLLNEKRINTILQKFVEP